MPIYKMDGSKDGLKRYRVRINYVDQDGKPRQIERVAYGNAEAKELERKLYEQIKNEAPTARVTFDSLCDDYLVAKKNSVRATTYDKTRRNLELYIRPTLGNLKLDRITPQRLQTWKNMIDEMDLGLQTKRNIYKELNIVLNWAVKLERIPKNPLSPIGTFQEVYFEKPQDKLHYYTSEEFLSYIAIAYARQDWPYYVFFSIAFYTGMRKGEINALRWSDIEGTTIHVRRSISQKVKGDDLETPPKNKSSYRDLQMPAPLIDILKEHKARQTSDPRFTEDYRVCGGAAVLRDTSIENKNKAYCKAADLPHIKIHDFRHTHASLLANEGISIQEIARRLGHSNVVITWNTYAHLYPREEERAVSILNQIKPQNV